MPKILPDRIIWDEDDWLGGLVPQFGNNLPLTIGNGAAFMRNINPFRQLGAIVPGFLPVAVTKAASITSLLKSGDVDYSGTTPYAYLIGGALVHKLDLSNDTIADAAPWPKTIAHGAHASIDGHDLKVFNVINAVTSVSSVMALYSFSDATDGDVGAYDISSGALNVFYDDFLSTQPTGAFALTTNPHPMIIGDDGALYIGDGRNLVKLTSDGGGNGTLETVLTLPIGTVIRSFTKSDDSLVIFASRSNVLSSSYYRGTATAYFWNYTSRNYNLAYDLSDNYVSAGFNWNGIIGCFTMGRTGAGGSSTTKLKLFNGSRFEKMIEYSGNPPIHGGVEIHDNMVVWSFVFSGVGYIGTYGTPWDKKGSFNFWGEGSGVSAGMCLNLGGTKLYVSTGTGAATGGLETFSGNYGGVSTSSFFQGIMSRLNFPSGMKGKIKSVKVHFQYAISGGRTLELRFHFNGVTTYSTVFTGKGTITDLTLEYIKDSSNIEFPHFHSIRPSLIWDTGGGATQAPAVGKVEVFYETVKNIQ